MNENNNNMPRRPPQKRKAPGSGSPFQGTSMWKYIIWFILLWVIFSFFFRGFGTQQSTKISYTKFKQEVKKGNVSEVTFQGDEITGKFKNKYMVVTNSGKDTTYYKDFASMKPVYSDPELTKILDASNVTVNAKSQGSSWLPYLLITILPWILIFGYFLYIRKKMQGQMKGMGGGAGGLFGVGKSKAKRYRESIHGVTYNDVAGLESAKQDLQEIIDYLKEPHKFTALGADIPKGVLLMGPPGTGKTLLARATAGEANVAFYSISGSEFIEMFVGVGASRVRDLFDNAKKDAPCIIFIDEIDSVGRVRGSGMGGGNDEREQTLNQILSEMDGFEPNESVVVMAATNRPDVLDPALIRPGRFDRQITLERPQKQAREKILRIHTRGVPTDSKVDLENIAARTVGFSGAELKNLVNEAALLAGRKNKKRVDMEDFEEARDKILLGAEREEKIGDEEKKVIAYHEGGHALVARLLPDTDPLQKVTIIPRGRALGVTEQVPEIDRHNFRRRYLLNRICVMLGGRASEKIVFNELTNGAASDLKQVTGLARRMVCQWGMSDKLGPVYFRQGEEHPFLGRELAEQKDFSEHTSQIIDEEIQRIINEMEEKAVDLLKSNRDKLDALANALLEHETLDREGVDKALGFDSKEVTKQQSPEKESKRTQKTEKV
ncbi:MAG: ATP-dependent zinc metalloprotease FtsH [Calditrichia bacterium]